MPDDYVFPVDSTAILAFAGALGETNKVYYDADHATATPVGGVIAPPTFAVAANQWDADYYLRGVRQIPEPTAAGTANARKPADGPALHAEMRFEYHRPMRPGMRVSVARRPGATWEKDGRKGGRLKFAETITEYRDESGALLVTTRSVSVTTGRPPTD